MRYWVQIALLSTTIIGAYNIPFWESVYQTYKLDQNIVFNLSFLFIVFWAVMNVVTATIAGQKNLKWIALILLILSSTIQYVQLKYNLVVEDSVLQNIFETNLQEAKEILNSSFFLILLFAGVLPGFVLFSLFKSDSQGKKSFYSQKFIFIIFNLLFIGLFSYANSRFLSSFLREHKPLRYRATPLYTFYSAFKLALSAIPNQDQTLIHIGEDARIPSTDVKKDLVIIVVGETARADHFSLNGYEKPTNPELAKENVISFKNVTSCGTSTAVSLPCMFDGELANHDFTFINHALIENLLDVLTHAKIDVLWRDNNSSSKGVADRVQYEDYKTPLNNTLCDIECRDLGMLVGLDKFIETSQSQDKVIVLHQMGSHGPGYYLRYPKNFEIFSPSCQSTELSDCSREEIVNAYDNSIVYTDYFLAQTIRFLKSYTKEYNTLLLYISDHGESLGENGVYLHSMPYSIAPVAQTHVPEIIWQGDNQSESINSLKNIIDYPLTHDHLFHSILGYLEIQSNVYKPELDIFSIAKSKTHILAH